MVRMRLFTLCWGEPYVSWFEHALIASLAWPDNLAAIRAHVSEHNIYTRDDDRERLRSVAERLGVPIQFHPFAMRNSSGETLQPALLDHLRNCGQVGEAAFIAPPDTIFGEGSISAICQIGSMANVCVAVKEPAIVDPAVPVVIETVDPPALSETALTPLKLTTLPESL